MIFEGAKYCAHCGEEALRVPGRESQLPCPRCKTVLGHVHIGQIPVSECSSCHGLWVDAATFERVCRDRDEQSMVLGNFADIKKAYPLTDASIRYVPCPVCKNLMHRVNFSKVSGIVTDVCKAHGTWFDRDELRRIVEFIQNGGILAAKQKELEELETNRRKLQSAKIPNLSGTETSYESDFWTAGGIVVFGAVLRLIAEFLSRR